MINIFSYNTIIGKLYIAESNNFIIGLLFGENEIKYKVYEIAETQILNTAAREIDEYLNGYRKEFDLPLAYECDTVFTKSVWDFLSGIGYGKTFSYKEIAIAMGNKNAARAVGNACNKNPIPILIPCHRVIGESGGLVGYRGGLEIKSKLLDIESFYVL